MFLHLYIWSIYLAPTVHILYTAISPLHVVYISLSLVSRQVYLFTQYVDTMNKQRQLYIFSDMNMFYISPILDV